MVRVAGVEVGKVTEIEFSGAEVEILMEVSEDMQSRITTESRAAIGALSLLGEPVIDISPSTAGTPLKDGETVRPGRAPGQFADVAESATQSLGEINGLLKDMRAGKGTAGKLFTDDACTTEINRFVLSAQVVAGTLSEGRGTLGLLVKDPAAYNRLNAALSDLAEHDGTYQRRRGEPRPAAEGRRAGEVAVVRVGQPRPGHREAESGRRDGREAADRQGALRPVQLAGGAGRSAHRRPAEGRGNRRPAAARQAVV